MANSLATKWNSRSKSAKKFFEWKEKSSRELMKSRWTLIKA